VRVARRVALIIAGSAIVAGCGGGQPATSASGESKGQSVNGVGAVHTRVLASATWQGMKVTARAGAPGSFVLFNGATETTIRPTRTDSFQLMVMLADAQSGVAIPYATVRATIRDGAGIVYDERQWPMISAFAGPGYGNNVSLPGAGTYHLSLLITPPVSARHLEYQHVWLMPHRLNLTFVWKPSA
jgi:Fe2+ transport protein